MEKSIFTKKIFELKEEHLKLLRKMIIGWDDCEFGAPIIDPKRPYGNSYVYEDIANILGIKGFKDYDDEISFSEEQKNLMDKLHRETETVLQIVLISGKFEAGTYEADEYHNNWELKL